MKTSPALAPVAQLLVSSSATVRLVHLEAVPVIGSTVGAALEIIQARGPLPLTSPGKVGRGKVSRFQQRNIGKLTLNCLRWKFNSRTWCLEAVSQSFSYFQDFN